MKTFTVNISKQKAENLSKLALRYGLSVENLASEVLSQISSDIGEESWNEYSTSSKISFKKGVSDFHTGKVYQTL